MSAEACRRAELGRIMLAMFEAIDCCLAAVELVLAAGDFLAWSRAAPNRDARRQARITQQPTLAPDAWSKLFWVFLAATTVVTAIILSRAARHAAKLGAG